MKKREYLCHTFQASYGKIQACNDFDTTNQRSTTSSRIINLNSKCIKSINFNKSNLKKLSNLFDYQKFIYFNRIQLFINLLNLILNLNLNQFNLFTRKINIKLNQSLKSSSLLLILLFVCSFCKINAGTISSNKDFLNFNNVPSKSKTLNYIRSNISNNDNLDSFKLNETNLYQNDYPEEEQFSVTGFRIEGEKVEIQQDGTTTVFSEITYKILLFGNFETNTKMNLSITPSNKTKGSECKIETKDVFNLEVISKTVAISDIKFSYSDAYDADFYYLCIDTDKFSKYQGNENWMRIKVKNRLLPIWLQIFFIMILLCLAGLFSGLNLGLMALDLNELEVIECCGTPTEKRYARRIKPVRKRGNYLLCTILLGNVMVQTTLTVLLEDLTSGLVAVIGSTLSIVIFGEIVPQAICSRQGLSIGANTVFLMYFFMLVTFPISFPISWLLDKVLGKEIGKIYDRDRLTEYLRITQRYNKLDTDELNIIQGALKLKKLNVAEIMTKLEDIFSLSVKSVLNFDTLSLIQKSGYSRIPIYDQERSNIVAVLFAKDLAFVDPNSQVPITTLCQFYNHELTYLFEDITLHEAFSLFKEGKSHMAFVVRVPEEGNEKDPHYEVIGLVTLEDVLEEVMQTEIVDETDVLTDNRKKKRRKEVQSRIDHAEFCFLNFDKQGHHVVSPQMALVSFQYLSTSVSAFSKKYMNEKIFKKLINQNVFHKEEPKSCYNDVHIFKLYEYGKKVDYFVLILEGYVQVSVGKENLSFHSGPFSIFGSSTLKIDKEDDLSLENLDNLIKESFEWTSDYTVEIFEKVTYFKLSRKLYLSAVRQSIIENNSALAVKSESMESLQKDVLFHNSINASFNLKNAKKKF